MSAGHSTTLKWFYDSTCLYDVAIIIIIDPHLVRLEKSLYICEVNARVLQYFTLLQIQNETKQNLIYTQFITATFVRYTLVIR